MDVKKKPSQKTRANKYFIDIPFIYGFSIRNNGNIITWEHEKPQINDDFAEINKKKTFNKYLKKLKKKLHHIFKTEILA